MPQIIVLPHEEVCPDGAAFLVDSGLSVCDALLKHDVHIEHACEKSCACTTCHVYIREGLESLDEATEEEDDYLDRAWGLDHDSRLSCQAVVANSDLVIEIPKYTVNVVSERQ